MKMMNKTLTYREGMSAADCVKDILELYAADGGNTLYYFVTEFPEHELYDIDGTKITCRTYQFDRPYLATLYKRKDTTNDSRFASICLDLEKSIGAPALYVPESVFSSSPKTVTHEAIDVMIAKIEKRISCDRKRLANHDIDEVVTGTEDDAASQTLRSLKENTLEQNIRNYYRTIVARERDKLFYIHRHPNVANMHRCQDVAILSAINIFDWYFLHKPIFEKGRSYGYSSF